MKLLGKEIPLDGVAVVAATWFLSENKTRIRNSLIIGALHGILHMREVNEAIEEYRQDPTGFYEEILLDGNSKHSYYDSSKEEVRNVIEDTVGAYYINDMETGKTYIAQ